LVDYVLALVEASHADKVLLSHDAGWYDPAQADGQPEGGIRGYTALVEEFLPALRARGLSEDVLRLLTVTNPARALAFVDEH
jgi:phosphotriesterase-related protein